MKTPKEFIKLWDSLDHEFLVKYFTLELKKFNENKIIDSISSKI
jgi:hypothetical protein